MPCIIFKELFHHSGAELRWCSSMFIPQTLHESAFDHHIFSHHGQSQKNFYHPCIRGMWSDSRTKETKKKSDDAGKKDGKEEDELSLKLDPLAALQIPLLHQQSSRIKWNSILRVAANKRKNGVF